MANDLLTVADFVSDALDVDKTETTEVLNQSPFVASLPIGDTSDGSETHKYNKYTGAPTVGFRSENAGRDYDASEDTVVTVTCKILDFSWRVDYAVANAWRQGPENLIAREGARHLAAALWKLEKQVIYGTGALGDANGFDGFADSTYIDALADGMVFGAGDATAASVTSCYAVRTGFDDVRLVTPYSRGVSLGETIVTEANDTNHPVYYTPASLYIGVQLGGAYSVGRICNIGASANGLDDDLISDVLSAFPANMGPNMLVMNRPSLKQLQQSRTATNPTGAPAPFPQSSFNVPILVTDSVVSTEAVVV